MRNINNNADGILTKHEFEEGPRVQVVVFTTILAIARFILSGAETGLDTLLIFFFLLGGDVISIVGGFGAGFLRVRESVGE